MTTRREKIIAGILVFFASLTLILGFVQMQKTLRAPLLFDSPRQKTPEALPSSRLSASIDPSKDTDGDGLPDTDELNRYGTSPYLADSDSDGRDDKIEISQGTDPNCPEGKQCGLMTRNRGEPQKPKTIADILEQGTATPPAEATPRQQSAPEGDPVTALRAALLAAGVPKEQLDQLSDVQLLEMYQETERDLEEKDTGN